MRDCWKYAEYVIWPIGLIILSGGIFAIVNFSEASERIASVTATAILLFGNFKGIPQLVSYLKLKGALNSFGKGVLNTFFTIADNQNILPYNKVSVEGFSKDTDCEYIRGKTKRIMLLNEQASVMKQKIALACTNNLLPSVSNSNLLDSTSLRALFLVSCVESVSAPNEKYELEKYVEEEIKKDSKLGDWVAKWKKISSAHNFFGTKKNLLYQFLCPKLENISLNNKTKKEKLEEACFLIDNLADYRLPIFFLLRQEEDYAKNGIKDDEIAAEIYNVFQNYPYAVLAARGSFIRFMFKVANSILTKHKNVKRIYGEERDIWIFPNSNKRPIEWLILKNESFK